MAEKGDLGDLGEYVNHPEQHPDKTPTARPERARSRKASGLPPHDAQDRGALIGDRRATRAVGSAPALTRPTNRPSSLLRLLQPL